MYNYALTASVILLKIYRRKTDFKLRKQRFKAKKTSLSNNVSLKLINTVNTISEISRMNHQLKTQGRFDQFICYYGKTKRYPEICNS